MADFWNEHGDKLQVAFGIFTMLFTLGWFAMMALGIGLFGILSGGMPGGQGRGMELLIVPCGIALVFASFSIYILLRGLAGMNMRLKLDKRAYSPDEHITGTITINRSFKSPARSLTVSFYGIERHGKRSHRTCKKQVQLSGARTFMKGEAIPFSIPIPQEAKARIAETPNPSLSIDGMPLFGARYIAGWCVEAKLDLPGEVDISKTAMVCLVAAGQQPAAGQGERAYTI